MIPAATTAMEALLLLELEQKACVCSTTTMNRLGTTGDMELTVAWQAAAALARPPAGSPQAHFTIRTNSARTAKGQD
jgi:hypothetical protein